MRTPLRSVPNSADKSIDRHGAVPDSNDAAPLWACMGLLIPPSPHLRSRPRLAALYARTCGPLFASAFLAWGCPDLGGRWPDVRPFHVSVAHVGLSDACSHGLSLGHSPVVAAHRFRDLSTSTSTSRRVRRGTPRMRAPWTGRSGQSRKKQVALAGGLPSEEHLGAVVVADPFAPQWGPLDPSRTQPCGMVPPPTETKNDAPQ